jgi:hypothetical protein
MAERTIADPVLDEMDHLQEYLDGRHPEELIPLTQEAVRTVIEGFDDPDGLTTLPLAVLKQRAAYLQDLFEAYFISFDELIADRQEGGA